MCVCACERACVCKHLHARQPSWRLWTFINRLFPLRPLLFNAPFSPATVRNVPSGLKPSWTERLAPGKDLSHQPRRPTCSHSLWQKLCFIVPSETEEHLPHSSCWSLQLNMEELQWTLRFIYFLKSFNSFKPITYDWAVAIVGGADLPSCFIKHSHLFLCSLRLHCQTEPFLPCQSEVVKGE